MSYTKNLTIRDLMNSIPSTQRVKEFFEEGVKTQNPIMAIPAMEELLRRGDMNLVMTIVDDLFYADGGIVKHANLAIILANAMADADGRTCALVRSYGQTLVRNAWLRPFDWVLSKRVDLLRTYRSGTAHQVCDWIRYLAAHDHPEGENWDEALNLVSQLEAKNAAIAARDITDAMPDDTPTYLSGPDQVKAGVEAAKNQNYVPDSASAMSNEYNRGYREGYDSGLKEGLKTGHNQGYEDGREVGRAEGAKAALADAAEVAD